MSVSATARFTVTVDVPLGAWNEAEKFESLRPVAKREGTQKLRQGLQGLDYKIVGEPKLLTMMTEER
ncbi:hypothetical protein [uncultured Sphingomonas sp.]|uniref:hypothetical protein n=1 Tax=uncultured Sphingomonas sp. TaxID=158754 RepID=UPI00259A7D9C|nr:hypothetical protein [uncultured Sphingomonas sp.]